MKRAVLLSLALIALTCLSYGHSFAPPDLGTVAASDSVYLVQVQSIDRTDPDVLREKITFTITMILKGNSHPSLVLTPYPDLYFDKYVPGSQWIVIHNPEGFKDGIGWAAKGDCEWLPAQITQIDGMQSAQWLGPLDGIKEYLQNHPTQP